MASLGSTPSSPPLQDPPTVPTDAMSAPPVATSNPYRDGHTLSLFVTATYPPWQGLVSAQLTVRILRAFPITMSPTMIVQLPSGGHAVLKMFDRRFGPQSRCRGNRPIPHTTQDEARWASFVASSHSQHVLQDIDRQRTTGNFPPSAGDLYEDAVNDGNPNCPPHCVFEAAVHDQAQRYFRTEVQAYQQLASLQGATVPRLYASISHQISSLLGPSASARPEFQAQGILIELINGLSGERLLNNAREYAVADLARIAQNAIDGAAAINNYGVLLGDCQPQNVIIRNSDGRVFYIDFSQAYFLGPHGLGRDAFWTSVRCNGNFAVMAEALAEKAREVHRADIASQLQFPGGPFSR
ncbi:hypothetical protein B0T26DRAFT_671328 [Lasiosphaeria miniovina]|uniref:Protein kinase domain-containing protein n=1 Tax=Lasiosphaeria miniovina TaxID=1954250 RepID=A0AA40BJ37_9PEZI|nr:uncharacterized protein B0T26DRAFT_671328 [Lasiosphaeria miniovina]KAK0735145.1 hypothetical protein B0T26DRAFT_671328 [Lasiosphaeria miniovina]